MSACPRCGRIYETEHGSLCAECSPRPRDVLAFVVGLLLLLALVVIS